MESGMRVPRLREEVAGAKLRDQRLTRRLMQIVESLGARPQENIPLSTHAEVREVVCWYARRWEIEVYFKTLKSGCRIEARDFEALGRERNFVAVALLLAWRVLLLCRLGRECPEIPCDVMSTPAEWKSMGMKHHEHRPWAERRPPQEPPPLGEMLQGAANLGGHMIRSPGRRTVPGTQTLWIGLACLTAYAQAWDLFAPGDTDPRYFKGCSG